MDLLRRIVKGKNPLHYTYNLHPMAPPLFYMIVKDEEELIAVNGETLISLVPTSEHLEVSRIGFERFADKALVSKNIWIGLDDGISVLVRISFLPNRILAIGLWQYLYRGTTLPNSLAKQLKMTLKTEATPPNP